MVLNPCWMPQAYVWLCWLICDYSSHHGPNYLLSAPCHPFQSWGLLIALSLSPSLSSSNSLSHCLAWIESQNTLVLLFLLLRTFYAKKALITKTLLRLVSFALGVCFIQQNSTEQSALGIQSPYPFSLKFSVFVTSSMVRVPAWRAWEFILPCKAGMDNVVKMFCRLQSDKQQGACVSLSSR